MEVGDTLSHYSLLERVGEGGFGIVWRALDRILGREVAIKVLPADLAANPGSLLRLKQEAKPFSHFLEIALPVVEGITAAHELGITHGDIKPRNVIMTESRRIKILDFGLALLARAQPPLQMATRRRRARRGGQFRVYAVRALPFGAHRSCTPHIRSPTA